MRTIPIQGREGADPVVVVQLLFLVGRVSVKSIIFQYLVQYSNLFAERPFFSKESNNRAHPRAHKQKKALAPTLVVVQLLFQEGRAPVCINMAKSPRFAGRIGPIGACSYYLKVISSNWRKFEAMKRNLEKFEESCCEERPFCALAHVFGAIGTVKLLEKKGFFNQKIQVAPFYPIGTAWRCKSGQKVKYPSTTSKKLVRKGRKINAFTRARVLQLRVVLYSCKSCKLLLFVDSI